MRCSASAMRSGASLIRDRQELGPSRSTQVGFTRLAHVQTPISGKPEIGVCSAPQRNQVYADCVNLSALLRCARDTRVSRRTSASCEQPTFTCGPRGCIVSGLLLTMKTATRTCEPSAGGDWHRTRHGARGRYSALSHPNSGLPEFGTLSRPKSDESDFGWERAARCCRTR
jgi:hypothetical protein